MMNSAMRSGSTGRQRTSQARARAARRERMQSSGWPAGAHSPRPADSGGGRRRQRRGATGQGDSSRRSSGSSRMPPIVRRLRLPVRIVLAHGASGSAASMRPHVEGLRARGVDAHAIDIPKRRAEDAVPAYLAAVAALPTLILEGEVDPFSRIDLLRAAMPLLPRGRLVTFPRLGHGLLPVLDTALDALVEWLGGAIVDRSVG